MLLTPQFALAQKKKKFKLELFNRIAQNNSYCTENHSDQMVFLFIPPSLHTELCRFLKILFAKFVLTEKFVLQDEVRIKTKIIEFRRRSVTAAEEWLRFRTVWKTHIERTHVQFPLEPESFICRQVIKELIQNTRNMNSCSNVEFRNIKMLL